MKNNKSSPFRDTTLGIGANTVVFSVAKAVLFRPLGFETPDRLMWIHLVNTQTGLMEARISWRDIEDVRESTRSIESVATFGSPGAIWDHGDRVEEVPALRVTANLGDTLRIRPVLGRMLLPSDVDDAAESVVLISYELWHERFGGMPEAIGQTVRLDEKNRTIVGVLPPRLKFPLERAPLIGTGSAVTPGLQSFWFPMGEPRGEDRTSRGARMYVAVARLKPNAAEKAARAELDTLGRRLSAEHHETNRHLAFKLVSFRDQILGRMRRAIPILAIAVAAVLLICCVNLANLLLARGVARHRELAVRLALGAGRASLVRAILVESVLLSLLGGALGIMLTEGALQGIRLLGPADVPFIREVTLDGAVMAFTAGLSVLTGVLFGLVPAWRHSRVEVVESLRSGTHSTGGPEIRVWQHGLLVGQLAVVLPLLASAGLLLESFRRLMGQDFGYQPHSVIALDLSTWGFQTNEELCRMYRALHARLAALPGVQAVGTISSVPLTGKWTFDEKAQIVDQPRPEADRPSLGASFVAFDYFQAMGIPLVEGRFFRPAELQDHGYGQIVIVNEAAARLLFPGRPALAPVYELFQACLGVS